ncbi:MAG: DNA mismatch repair protein MutS [Candidatus Firestonebacteria bacterium]
MSDFTPMMRQYQELKKQYPEAILFFRLGDFYEVFFDDAKTVSKLLEITLTSREAGKGKRAPMAGVPHYTVNTYIGKLIKYGYKVAICDQMEDPKFAKGIVKREIVKIVTPGTVLESNLLDGKTNNYLVVLNFLKNIVGVAAVDLSTGEFQVTEIPGDYGNIIKDKHTQSFPTSGHHERVVLTNKLADELVRFKPAECIVPASINKEQILKWLPNVSIVSREDWCFAEDTGREILLEQFKIKSLVGFGCENLHLAVGAAGVALNYLKETQKTDLSHITKIVTYTTLEFMSLDFSTQKNLELIQRTDGQSRGTLFDILDLTLTPMGARMLRSWMLQPLLNVNEIKKRQDAVEELYNEFALRMGIRDLLSKIYDIERLAGKIGCKSANAKDLIALSSSLKIIPVIKEKLKDVQSWVLKEISVNLDPVTEIVELVDKGITEEPPFTIKEGGVIKNGYSEELDKLRQISKGGKDWITALEDKEKKRTGIGSLKVRFNSVFGYYIEITKSNLSLVPADYIRKQTVVNAERFITPELKEYESVILGADEKINNMEYEIFCEIRDKVAGFANRIQDNAKLVAILDACSSLAEVALKYNYIKPKVNESDTIVVKNGRHPVIERLSSESFVPNDVYLDSDTNQILIITGPNMAGKSTYLRQVALIVLMAQMGSFIPADSAEIGIVDRIFTRVGAADNLIAGQSTFMVEMSETANMLNNATSKSLIILDEVGRGTSTFDGISIAWSVVEYLHNNKQGAKTLFATHFYELTELEMLLPRVKNYNIVVKEWNEEIIFLRKIIEGSADRSYGIQVARLAGLPKEVLHRAKEILKSLEDANYTDNGKPRIGNIKEDKQISLFENQQYLVIEELQKLDVEKLTPIDAINKLNELKSKL